jgi:hypothetical protein
VAQNPVIIDQCKLCLETKELQDSHLIPKAVYKKTRTEGGGNPNPTLISARGIVQTSRQITDYLLCKDCEDRFNKNGENYVMGLINGKGQFPLLKILRAAQPQKVTPVFTHYDLKATPEIDRDKLGYFALSVFWRAAVHSWDEPDDSKPMIDLGQFREPIRKYLRGEACFPEKIALMFVVCTDNLSQNAFYAPNKGNADQETFTFQIRGLNFFLMVDQPQMAAVCGITGADKWILARSCEDKVQSAVDGLISGKQTSR